jgi:hypothetical protein
VYSQFLFSIKPAFIIDFIRKYFSVLYSFLINVITNILIQQLFYKLQFHITKLSYRAPTSVLCLFPTYAANIACVLASPLLGSH